jgi:SNF-related kinase
MVGTDDIQPKTLLPQRQKGKLIHLLWEHLPKHTNQLASVPSIDKSLAEDKRGVGQYEFTEVLGKGQFASVYGVTINRERQTSGGIIDTPSETALAIKAIKKEKVVNLMDVQRVNNEIQILGELAHEGIVKIFGVLHTKRRLYIVTDRGGTDLFDFFNQHPGGIKEVDSKNIVLQISAAVNHCHRHEICHRDLKPENILISQDQRIKLVDFGLCSRVKPGQKLGDFCGSPGFFAPEMILASAYNGFAVDVWSLGCILLEVSACSSIAMTTWLIAFFMMNVCVFYLRR